MPSPTPDWTSTPYVRIYATLAADHPDVWHDLGLLGAYVHCLTAADLTYPAPAQLPRSVSVQQAGELAAAGVLDWVDEARFTYRFHGLESERRSRMQRGFVGGKARAAAADRGPGGRFGSREPPDSESAPLVDGAGGSAGDGMLVDAGWLNGNGHVDEPDVLVNGAGDASWRTSEPAQPRPPLVVSQLPSSAGDTTSSSLDDAGPGLAVAGPTIPSEPGANPCRDQSRHTSEFRYAIGVGWYCVDCTREEAAADPRSFRDKVRAYGGPEL